MTGLVLDIKRGGIKDGPGLRTSVFLKGCPLRCAWCHNPESQSAVMQRDVTTGEICGRSMSVEEVLEEVVVDRPFYGAEGGVTITGGEPTMQADFAVALATAAHGAGIHVALDTCGFAHWQTFERLLPDVDLFLYDLKCLDSARHKALTGVANTLILENLRRLDHLGVRYWIRAPLVPGLNDSDSDLQALAAFVRQLKHLEKFEICPYHPFGLEKYRKFGMTPAYLRKTAAETSDLVRWRAQLMDVIS